MTKEGNMLSHIPITTHNTYNTTLVLVCEQ